MRDGNALIDGGCPHRGKVGHLPKVVVVSASTSSSALAEEKGEASADEVVAKGVNPVVEGGHTSDSGAEDEFPVQLFSCFSDGDATAKNRLSHEQCSHSSPSRPCTMRACRGKAGICAAPLMCT